MKYRQIVREMGVTHKEFFRLLPSVTGTFKNEIDNNIICIYYYRGSIKIHLAPETQRSLGALRLPVTKVKFDFEGLHEHQIEEFMQRFDLSFRRGGG